MNIVDADATWTERKRTTKEHLKERFREGDVDSGIQVQLEKDGGGSTDTEEWYVAYVMYIGSHKAYISRHISTNEI